VSEAVAGAAAVEAPAEGLRRVLANILALLLAYALPRAALFASAIVAARVLGAAAFGAYGTAAAFAVILSIGATLGMQPLLVREIARAPASAATLLRAATAVKTAAIVVLVPFAWALAAGPLGYERDVVAAALLLVAGYAVGAYVENLAAYFQAAERMHVWTQASAAFGAVTACVAIVLVITTRSPVWFAAAPVAGQLAALGWLRARLPASARAGARIAPGDVLRLARALAPFAAAFVALTLYYKADVLLLAAWTDAAEVGRYTAAYKLVDLTQALVLVLAAALYPRLARSAPAAVRSGEAWAAGRVLELLLLAAVPAAGVAALLRDRVVGLLYGAEYAAAAPALGVLAAVAVPLACSIFGGYALAAAGHVRDVALTYTFGFVVNIGLNAFLIPRAGGTGAALAMLASEAAVAAALTYALRLRTGARMRPGPLSCAAMLAGLACACAFLPVSAVAGVSIFAAATAGLYAAAGVVPRTERALLRAALRRSRPA
jgi:O-antigen/teichoic acid export membrane protein